MCEASASRSAVFRISSVPTINSTNLPMLETIGKFVAQNWRIPVEIGILAAVLYYIYIYLRGTHGARILIGLALLFLTLTFLSQFLISL